MELNWLEDFLALAEQRNFSRAAQARNVTQPAFSRRIQALEHWVGTPLVDRSPQGVALNPAGLALREPAAALVRDLQQMRRAALRAAGQQQALSIAATHALSFTFFPDWIRGLAALRALGRLNLVSDSMAAGERALLAGEVDFLLCHASPGMPTPLDASCTSLVVGQDQLLPVSAPDATGKPRWSLPGSARLLAYAAPSGLGRILQAGGARDLALETVVTAPLAAALHSLALQGEGLAWLPRSMAAADLAAGRLVIAASEAFTMAVDIRLFRPRRSLSGLAENFWGRAEGKPGT